MVGEQIIMITLDRKNFLPLVYANFFFPIFYCLSTLLWVWFNIWSRRTFLWLQLRFLEERLKQSKTIVFYSVLIKDHLYLYLLEPATIILWIGSFIYNINTHSFHGGQLLVPVVFQFSVHFFSTGFRLFDLE